MLAKFDAYQLSLELYRECAKLSVPHHLKDQLSRASLSICLNLAEGSGKPTPKDRRRFYAIALGSGRELQAVLDILEESALRTQADRLGGMLYCLVHRH